MFDRDDAPRASENPVDEQSRVPVAGADGWYYLPFEQLDNGAHLITLVRDDGVEAQMTLPAFVEQGDELGEVARLVIRARERWRDLKGLGA